MVVLQRLYMHVNDVRLRKNVPKRRLHLLAGDSGCLPQVGDIGVSDHASAGFWGTLTDLYVSKRDGQAKWMIEAYDSEFEYTIAQRFDVAALNNAQAYGDDIQLPCSILSYPTSVADKYGLPPFEDAELVFAELQSRGVELGVWANPSTPEVTCLVCRHSDHERVETILAELQANGIVDPGFLAKWSEQLFTL